MTRFLKRLFGTREPGLRAAPAARLGLEVMENRLVPAAPTLDAYGTLRIDGTAGNDTCYVSQASPGSTLNSPVVTLNGVTTTFLFRNVNRVVFFGGDGNDYFDNDLNAETIAYGGSGNDVLLGGPAVNRLYGEDGNDYLNFLVDPVNFYAAPYQMPGLTDGWNLNSMPVSQRVETASVWGVTYAYGGAGDDAIRGGYQADQLSGGDGRDFIYGGAGDDVLLGDGGHDELYGQSGNDSLYGGQGSDHLYGGYGDDYLDGGRDEIPDFLVGGVDAKTREAEISFAFYNGDPSLWTSDQWWRLGDLAEWKAAAESTYDRDTFVRYQKTGWTSDKDDVFVDPTTLDVTVRVNLDDTSGFGGGNIWAG